MYWQQVYIKELNVLQNMEIFAFVDSPQPPERPIPLVKLFKIKKDFYWNWVARARLYTNDNKDRSQFKYRDASFYAPVAPIATIKILLCVPVGFKMWIRQMDITAAFAYGSLPNDIYLELPKENPQ
eukprot:snap_masked-scaffold_3-processed-gene-13.4-mRNA-1 protein AED:1.00 eAED:1.00 QI:0/-1/0/0/-1/1/1/0/125